MAHYYPCEHSPASTAEPICEILKFKYYGHHPVFHLAISNIAQRHVAFCERHVALHVRHVAFHVRHVALPIFRLVYKVVIAGDVYVYLPDSVCTLNWGGWVLEMPNRVNWVPSGHDKVPPMIGGAMHLLNPR